VFQVCREKGLPVPRSVTLHRLVVVGCSGRVAVLSVVLALLALPALSPAQPPDAPPDESSAPATEPPAEEPDPAVAEPAAPADAEGEAAPAAEDSGTAGEKTGPKLPGDFMPPPAELPEVMTLRNPLMTDDELKKEGNELERVGRRGIDTILRLGDPSPENIEYVKRWAKYEIARLTAVKEWSEAGKLAKELRVKVQNAAVAQTNVNREREFREAVCAAIVDACKGVLDNNFHVRLQAAVLLSSLDIVAEEVAGSNRRPAEAYVPALGPLLEILAGDQPPAVKVAAAKGVIHIGDHAVIPPQLKQQAGDVLTAELAKGDTFWWYQVRLAEALAAIELDVNAAREPIVIQALMAAIADDKRHCLARSAAAKALSRTRIPAGGFDEKAAANRLVELTRDMSLEFNKNPAAMHWHECFVNTFDAFRPVNANEVSQLPADSLLRRGSLPAAYEDAFQRILPIVRHVFSKKPGEKNQPIPQDLIQQLSELVAAAE
jgi:hypothetical protein